MMNEVHNSETVAPVPAEGNGTSTNCTETPIPIPGYTILHLRALRDGIAPHGVASEIGLRDAHYYAIECGYHPGDPLIWESLSSYYGESEEVLKEAAFRQRRLEKFLARQRRHNLLTFHLLGGYTITGTFESADEGSVKLIENTNQRKVMINRVAITAWRFISAGQEEPIRYQPPRSPAEQQVSRMK